MPELVRETYLEVRLAQTHTVIAVLELLSPANKRPGEGRQQYERKRLQVLTTCTHWVEIDLLRGGEPMAMDIRGQSVASHYRILISRAEHRPRAMLLPFNVRHLIPSFRLPLQPGDDEPLARIIHHPKNRSEKGFLKPSEASKQPYPRLVTLPKAGCQIVLTLCQAV
jgi:hypothetical protein